MKFFFPDSQDQIDPNYDFQRESNATFRVRQRDDRYAHEVLSVPAYDGILLSKPIIDGLTGASGKYTNAQRQRLYRLGARRFFRLDGGHRPIESMGDCGSFTYVREETPPYTVADVADFYDGCGLDYGIAIDHVVLGYDPSERSTGVEDWRRRQQLTLDLAVDFLRYHRKHRCRFVPIGVAQGWSPRSYASSVARLQRIGYDYIALGGLVPLKTNQITDCLAVVNRVRHPGTQLHLLGISRVEQVSLFGAFGVASFDSTSPFRQAFKDDKNNYFFGDRAFAAIRVPQADGNTRLRQLIQAGRIDQTRARSAEHRCLKRLAMYDNGQATLNSVLDALAAYGDLLDGERDYASQNRELLELAPWKRCNCGICSVAGIQVCVLRGTERNKRRGFHNLHVFRQRLLKRRSSPIVGAPK